MTDSAVWAGKKMGGKKWIILLPMIPPFYQPLREIPRQDRQKNGGRRIGAAGVPPSSFILHPSSFILHPSSFILHPSSFIICLALALTPAERVASLIDPAKLATLAARGANPRVQKYTAQLHDARLAGQDAAQVAVEAVALTGMTGEAARLTAEAMLRNLTIAERLGCLTPAGLHDMRRGQSPTITLGPYTGDLLSVDHVIPFSVAPALDKVIANLELMPLRMNIGKRDRMGERQQALARRFRSAGLF